LYKIFGDWDLALAAYNSGPGNVTKAIRRSGGYKNYWNIRPFLPRETAGYLPAFVTTMYLMEYADFYGFNKKETHYKFHETDTLKVKDKLSFDILSEKIDMPLELVKYLNPSYKLDVVPNQSNKDFYIRLPFSYVNKFIDLENDIYKSSIAYLDQKEKYSPQLFDYSSRVYYTVKSGDYLGKIADNFGVRVSEIKKWNGLRNDNVRVGQRLKVYPRRAPKHTVNKKYTGKPKVTYKVAKGDTLWDISKKFPGVSISDIKYRNNLSSSSLNIGTVLVIE
jgi:membrane-bound lytic murein transglycosylase D